MTEFKLICERRDHDHVAWSKLLGLSSNTHVLSALYFGYHVFSMGAIPMNEDEVSLVLYIAELCSSAFKHFKRPIMLQILDKI